MKIINLKVTANYTFIVGSYDAKSVDRATRYRKTGYQHSSVYKNRQWDGYTRLFIRSKHAFPTGLLERVKRIYKKDHEDAMFNIDDRRSFGTFDIDKVEDVELNGVTLREHQVLAGNAMLKKGHGILWAATNSGKTEVAIALIKCINKKTLFLTKGISLTKQTYERFCTRLGDTGIGLINSKDWDVRQFTIASADTLTRRFDPTKKTTESKAKQREVYELITSVDVIIIDECHQAAGDGLFNLLRSCTAPYRFGLSGTPFKRSDNQDLKLVALTGEVVYRVTNKEMIEAGVSTPTTIHMMDIEYPVLPTWLQYEEAYQAGIVDNDYRNLSICRLTERYYAKGKQVLVLVERLDHGYKLDRLLHTFKPNAFIPHEYINGHTDGAKQADILKSFDDGVLRVLVSSRILDVGIDIKSIDVLILAAGQKAYIRALQRIGRGLRLNEGKNRLLVIDFCDRTHSYLASHSLARMNTYKGESAFTLKIKDPPLE